MIIPIRCFSCGNPVGHLWEEYKELTESGKTEEEALDKLKLKKVCCRGVMLSNVDSIEIIGQY